jgi:hypothetical protein
MPDITLNATFQGSIDPMLCAAPNKSLQRTVNHEVLGRGATKALQIACDLINYQECM